MREQPRREPAYGPAAAARRVCRPLSRLLLTGFMGAGKSSVGALLAGTLGWQFLDLDCVIEASQGQSVAEIFRVHGEPYFRNQERRSLEALGRKKNMVLALGGGTIEDPGILTTLLGWDETCLVFLDAPLPELMARILEDPRSRPLLAKPDDLEARHRRRLPLYRAAHVTVSTSGLDQSRVAARVLENIRESWQIRERAIPGKE